MAGRAEELDEGFKMNRACVCGAAVILMSTFTAANEVLIAPAKDNTLYSDLAGLVSNGAGPHFIVGNAGLNTPNTTRRGLIAFDIAGNVPPGATIDSVDLTLHMSRTVAGPESLAIHRVLKDWGEGASNAGSPGGMGAASQRGDATWIHTSFDTGFWQSAGGDFQATSSAARIVDDIGFYTWPSTARVVEDVQSWLDVPEANSGWVIIGDETTNFTTKRFDTRENPNSASRPVLTVRFCDPCDMNCDGDVNAVDIERFLGLLFGGEVPCDTCTGDANGDGVIDAFDIEPFVSCLVQ